MRLLIGFLTFSLLLLQYRLWLSDDGLREVWRLEAEVLTQTSHNGELANRNAELNAEVLDLKQGLAAAEERARSELGMVGNDETFFQIMPRAPD
jgi:cell division protein FtsB